MLDNLALTLKTLFSLNKLKHIYKDSSVLFILLGLGLGLLNT